MVMALIILFILILIQYNSNDIHSTARRTMESFGNLNVKYKINCLIDCPEALLQAHTFAPLLDSITFNTTSITELVYGASRGDLWIDKYVQKHVFPFDPFVRIDEKSVGALCHIAINKAKLVNKKVIYIKY